MFLPPPHFTPCTDVQGQKLVGLFSCWYRSSFVCAGKWCTARREWPSPADARAAAANDARRGVLYSSVFLGSPGEYNGTSPQDSSISLCSGVGCNDSMQWQSAVNACDAKQPR
jgi:hypothetical protein